MPKCCLIHLSKVRSSSGRTIVSSVAADERYCVRLDAGKIMPKTTLATSLA
jgi:hypothetical protein